MAVAKRDHYTKKILLIADIGKAVSHPARVEIIHYLQEYGVGDNLTFQPITRLCSASVTQHIKELEKARLIRTFYLDGGKCELTKECLNLLGVLGDLRLRKNAKNRLK